MVRETAARHLFGPVPSRRFGRSLGVDLTPFKTCSFDCIYCQLGRTTVHTMERTEFVPTAGVLEEVAQWCREGRTADVITLAGSGEPTLHTGFGEILTGIRALTKTPTVLLTNGSTLFLPEVRKAASGADIVKVTLSAWDQESFALLHRPCPGATFARVLDGLQNFRAEFSGKLWLEAFLVAGVNAAPDQVALIAEQIRQIRPDRVHLNTCVRPPAEQHAVAVSPQGLAGLASLFTPPAEVVAAFAKEASAQIQIDEDGILETLRRRPCTARQLADVFGMHLNEISKYLGDLVHTNRIRSRRQGEEVYYLPVQH